MTRFLINKNKTTIVAISQNTHIRSIKKDEWYISHWAYEQDGVLKMSPTIPGYFGNELFKWLKKGKFTEVEDEGELAKFVLLLE